VAWEESAQVYECREHWPKDTARQFFTVVSLVLQYIVPCDWLINNSMRIHHTQINQSINQSIEVVSIYAVHRAVQHHNVLLRERVASAQSSSQDQDWQQQRQRQV